ncbi:hypothetical protein QRE66_28285 (plasmid) [Bacillus cereus]|uniref:hypothetical protein n=1 Tax=Bacillus pseudomycoides TaxID=64104 RepID=UPI00197B020A|nr:hypothetical protein [Bacillus pseudomycoides]WJE55698.1 hypothetical protein QRE66_28285 [Bacillus cereus]
MVQTQSNPMNGPQALAWYNVEVKRGKNTFEFEIYRESDSISVFYVEQFGRQQMIQVLKRC